MVKLAGYLSTLGRLLLVAIPALLLYAIFALDVLTYMGNHPWALLAFFVVLLILRLCAPLIRRLKAYDV